MSNKITGKWHGKRYDYEDNERSTVRALSDSLVSISENYNVVGIKQSFEDEGAILSDVVTMRRVTELSGLKMYVKIGGCEAITDINNCVSNSIDAIIAPMIETEYAFKKFATAVKNIKKTDFYFLCETSTAYENIDSILSADEVGCLAGVILGRSDFTKSYDLDKNQVDSGFIGEKVRNVFEKSKKLNLTTTMGGNISVKSKDFIRSLYNDGLLDKIETRNVVVELNEDNVHNLEKTISNILNYEIEWLKFKAENYDSISKSYIERIETLQNRI
tara:strand:+ start:4397 stop:5218 length:822 start_codon:yes stop_codon:yes gene_type:complete